MSGVVLVTGVSDPGVAHAARVLAERGLGAGLDKVVGVDATPPQLSGDLGDVKFVRADVRTPVMAKILAFEDVDTVVHLGLRPASGSARKEVNVIGTMQVLAACQRSDVVRKFILGSSTAVYGTSPRDPAVWKESGTARGGVRSGFPKDAVEVEGYTRGFARRRPDVQITTLRFAQVLSPRSPMPLATYLRGPLLPTVAGFDPRLQVVHPHDSVEVIVRAVLQDHPGTFNVAADGTLLLSQVARMLGRPTLPLPPIGTGVSLRRVAGLMGGDISADLHRLLTYGRVVDTTALREQFGYAPEFSTAETFEAFAAAQRPGLFHLARPHVHSAATQGAGR